MTLKELYKLPDGSNAILMFTPSFYDDKENFICPSSMSRAFNGYLGFSIPMLDVSNVTNMEYMFYNCGNLLSLDLSSWDTSNVVDINNIFYGCGNLVRVSSIKADSLLISTTTIIFGTSTNSKLVDFGGFINLKSSWNGSHCADKLTALSHQSLINILNGLYDFTGNGVSPTSSQGKLKLGTTHLAKLSDDEKAIATNKGWVLS